MPKATQVSTALYRTASLELAAYLVASNRLELDHVEPSARHSEFFFLDPEHKGNNIAREYVTTDLQCSAKLILAARAMLLNEMRRVVGVK